MALSRLTLMACGLGAVLLSCTSAPRPPEPEPELAPPTEVPPLLTPVVTPEPTTEPARWLEGDQGHLSRSEFSLWSAPSPLDLDSWAFGWVMEPSTTARLGLPPRFWSDQKPRWVQALAPEATLPVRARRLQQILASQPSAEEQLRAVWLLADVTSRSGLREEARQWLDQAWDLTHDPSVALERAWDQVFRLGDIEGGRALWPGNQPEWTAEEVRKGRLLRARLFSGTRALPEGAGGFVSTQVLDRDDLWAATWNGAVVRWSLQTDQVDLMLPRGTQVAPITQLVVTAWFVYAFQDQSLLRYSKVTGSWRTFPYPPGWTGLRVQGVLADGEESLWVAHLGLGLWHWDRGDWTLVDDGGGGPFLNALAAAGDGGFWIGTKDRGLWHWQAGTWTPVSTDGPGPVNVSVIEPDPSRTRWFIGSWGEGTWILEQGSLTRWSVEPDYVTSAAWEESGPVWGALDQGVVRGYGEQRELWGPRDGVVTGNVSALLTWAGRWIWATEGQGWGWWSEYENPALLH